MQRNYTDEEASAHLKNIKRQSEVMKTHMKINNAKRLTCLSCCLFAPVTLPYIYYQNAKIERLLRK